ncbi:uncharacterized protein LAESUDRAFT_359312 [Laetiporus sulphureus 93-53]|uniref:Uncharacterized protein n=1 Tax=Laetiporus sulphureus 93-53 TaxID=1314785 RepID=A0A165GXS2_9APHY|nr:uncharacterized protein LAESUDRAFT_359312 [Laetiporus sulphureus 93-53]KZT10973.1 hypothetical protein LAESUDRAFT_359312 [Laetiporus sulphureus 93-53]
MLHARIHWLKSFFDHRRAKVRSLSEEIHPGRCSGARGALTQDTSGGYMRLRFGAHLPLSLVALLAGHRLQEQLGTGAAGEQLGTGMPTG